MVHTIEIAPDAFLIRQLSLENGECYKDADSKARDICSNIP
jgi:hypothetical protein